MNSQILIIYNFDTLFEILDEIKENLNFKLIKTDTNSFKDLNLNEYENFLIVSEYENKIKNCLNLKNLPLKIEKIVEIINVELLSSKFNNQSSIKIGKYNLNLNSRQISDQRYNLYLTEKEIDIILFINKNNVVNLKELQKNVWRYSSELETHTVETHIYRLRKKFFDTFKDNSFIMNNKKGYYLN